MGVACVNLVMYNWWEDIPVWKEEWKCVWTTFGEQCVVTTGTIMKLVLSVLNLDSQEQVNNLFLIVNTTQIILIHQLS